MQMRVVDLKMPNSILIWVYCGFDWDDLTMEGEKEKDKEEEREV